MNVDDLLKTTVDDAVRDVPPGFADGAIRRGRRARRLARAAAGGGAALVVAAAAVAAVVVPSSLRDSAEPPAVDRPPAEEPAPGMPDVVLDLGALGRGPEPAVPWYEPAGILHFGTEQSPHVIESDYPALRRVDGGFVVWDELSLDQPERSLVFVPGSGGHTVEIAGGPISLPVVSPDGTRVAWAVSNGDRDTDTSTLLVADATTGEVQEELPGVPGPSTRPMGFLDDDTILVQAGANTVSGLHTWELGGGLTPYRDETAVDAMSPAGDLLALTGAAGGIDVVDVASDATLWTLRDGYPLAFSPDGSYLAVGTEPVRNWLTPEDLATARPGDVIARDEHEVTVTQDMLDTAARYPDGWDHLEHLVVLDARTGAELLRVEGELPELSVVWESGTSVVFSAYQDSAEAALVRCTVRASCELATEPAVLDDDPDTYDIPYRLGF
ncbi:WD40 repeat domain-containing protein [Jiangella endophytica]|uniref:WD40 repeat domain-containing protein n=1 Tax=Jiangella endophytica TaxID=1623398 RepID=UPI000E350CDC|nr:WD40 repeat domain-containing protein [Jiangella endophytica]